MDDAALLSRDPVPPVSTLRSTRVRIRVTAGTSPLLSPLNAVAMYLFKFAVLHRFAVYLSELMAPVSK